MCYEQLQSIVDSQKSNLKSLYVQNTHSLITSSERRYIRLTSNDRKQSGCSRVQCVVRWYCNCSDNRITQVSVIVSNVDVVVIEVTVQVAYAQVVSILHTQYY